MAENALFVWKTPKPVRTVPPADKLSPPKPAAAHVNGSAGVGSRQPALTSTKAVPKCTAARLNETKASPAASSASTVLAERLAAVHGFFWVCGGVGVCGELLFEPLVSLDEDGAPGKLTIGSLTTIGRFRISKLYMFDVCVGTKANSPGWKARENWR